MNKAASENNKILLVEENEIWQSGIYNLLRTKNIKVTDIVNNTETAINMIKKLQPDLVITDISSKQIDGFSIFKEIKMENYPSKTIFLCSSSNSVKIHRAIQLGVEGLCKRTNNLAKLEKAIEVTLNGDIYIDGELRKALITTKTRNRVSKFGISKSRLKYSIILDDFHQKGGEAITVYNNIKNSKEESFLRLSETQQQIFAFLCKGKSNQQIADIMHFDINNIKYHVKQVKKKLNVETRMEVVLQGIKFGVVS